MVAIFKTAKSLVKAIKYNERKVASGSAALIGEGWYGKELQDLTFQDKIYRLYDLSLRNERTERSVLHISLNFSNDDQLNEERLNAIAGDYLERIELRGQPFLVYQHFDAGHKHVHIVTSYISPSGERIRTHDRKLVKTFAACRAIEKKYGLQNPREERNVQKRLKLMPIIYGQCETKKSLSFVVREILSDYKVSSLQELNAALSQFNIECDRGSEGSKMYLNGGLIYRITKNGKRIGAPVKASSIQGAPTIKNLELLFQKNKAIRHYRKEDLVNRLNAVLSTGPTEAGLLQALKRDGISVALDRDELGHLSGVTYIDNLLGVVFDGNELGGVYSAAGLATSTGNFKEVLDKLKVVSTASKQISYLWSAIPEPDPNRNRQSKVQTRKQGFRL